MILIIAEKPNQARAIADTLGGFKNNEGYLQSDKYYIAWCYGHMIQLETDDKYRNPGDWSKSYLPLIPQKYLYTVSLDANKKPDSGKKKQLAVIKNLMSKSTELINATDADREGELIFQYVYRYLNCTLPYRRLWATNLTPGDIMKAYRNLRSSSEMVNLTKSAYARAIADWLVGVNGTQAATLQFSKGPTLTIGRVQTAILRIICERYLKNKSFQKTYTYKLRANHTLNVPFFSESDVFERKDDASKIVSGLSEHHICTSVQQNNTKAAPPLLYSINTLIMDANRTFGYSSQETLDIAQSLYEKKLTSYPRTDSEYINQENFQNIKSFLPGLVQRLFSKPFSISNPSPKSVDDSKLTGSHDAIVPTGDTSALEALRENERNVYKLTVLRCMQSFSEPAEYLKTKITFDNNGTSFHSNASKLLHPGWKRYTLKNSMEESESPNNEAEQEIDIQIKQGDRVRVAKVEILEIESKPPSLYSDVNLINDLMNFGKLLKQENPEMLAKVSSTVDIDKLQIGTEATRPGMIERLKKLKYIEVQKNKFIPTELGLSYYQIIKDLAVSNVLTTALWEMRLQHVAEGKEDVSLFYDEIKKFTQALVHDIFSRRVESPIEFHRQTFGQCPQCGRGQIRETKSAFGCTEYKPENKGCNFTIWKQMAGKKITASVITSLLTKGESGTLSGFKNKQGKPFKAKLRLTKDYKVEFF